MKKLCGSVLGMLGMQMASSEVDALSVCKEAVIPLSEPVLPAKEVTNFARPEEKMLKYAGASIGYGSSGAPMEVHNYQITQRCDRELAVALIEELTPTSAVVAFVSLTGLSKSMHYDEQTRLLHLKADTRDSTTTLDLLIVLDSGLNQRANITVIRECPNKRNARSLGDCTCPNSGSTDLVW